MATKLFTESDSWGDSSGASDTLTFSFKKPVKEKIKESKKEKKLRKQKQAAEAPEDPNAGRFVRAPEYYEQQVSETVPADSPVKSKKDKKRKHEKNGVNGDSPEAPGKKKLKKQPAVEVVAEVKEPATYGDKLRESLKGSRFRFLNEQMYKQKGEESLQIFKEDPTAFDAYHEGYRHQIAQWPMNPLDRIIKNLKRL